MNITKAKIGRTPKARKLRAKRRRRPLKRETKRTDDRVRGSGPPTRNVKGWLGVVNVLPGPKQGQYAWGPDKCCTTCCTGRLASMSVTWEFWHKGRWRETKRYLCDKHAKRLKLQLTSARS